jgi:imidazolonepropionase-like amidohydrolase
MTRLAVSLLVICWQVYGQARIVLQASTVLDGKGGVLKDQRLVINGSRIESIGKAAGEATYDLRGLTLMPGWIDTHVHLDWHFDETHHITNRSKESRETLVLYSAENAWLT